MSKVLVLRTCNSKLKSHGGFQWPREGYVEAPDWVDDNECGNGLHGFLWGEGDGSLADWSDSAIWLVVEVEAKDIVNLEDKVKFPRGFVKFAGNRFDATNFLVANGGAGRAIIGGTATAGDYGTATAGYEGTASAGDYGTASAGYKGTASAGDYGTASAGYKGTASAGEGGKIRIRFWDGKRFRLAVGYVGENGILPNQPYRVVDGKLVAVS